MWLTPPEVLDPIREGFPFLLDPCTEPNNPTGADLFFTSDMDGLGRNWARPCLAEDGGAFVNPPYGRLRQDWGPKILAEAMAGCPMIALLPSRTDRGWFRSLIDVAWYTYFWPGRLKFLRPDGSRGSQAPYPSVLMAFNCVLPQYQGGVYARSLPNL